jgi:hypothetical protein
MTISHEERPVPNILPAARLYLEDIEEIVKILRHNGKAQQVTFKIGRDSSDDIQDLPKIARRTIYFEIFANGPDYSAQFTIHRVITAWTTQGLTREQTWSDFRKLEAIFERRKLHWKSLLHRSPQAISIVGVILGLSLIVAVLLDLTGRSRGVVGEIVFQSIFILEMVLAAGLYRHSIVIMRNSWDHEAAREDLRTRIVAGAVPALIGAVLGGGIALLGVYLRHKYWP